MLFLFATGLGCLQKYGLIPYQEMVYLPDEPSNASEVNFLELECSQWREPSRKCSFFIVSYIILGMSHSALPSFVLATFQFLELLSSFRTYLHFAILVHRVWDTCVNQCVRWSLVLSPCDITVEKRGLNPDDFISIMGLTIEKLLRLCGQTFHGSRQIIYKKKIP